MKTSRLLAVALALSAVMVLAVVNYPDLFADAKSARLQTVSSLPQHGSPTVVSRPSKSADSTLLRSELRSEQQLQQQVVQLLGRIELLEANQERLQQRLPEQAGGETAGGGEQSGLDALVADALYEQPDSVGEVHEQHRAAAIQDARERFSSEPIVPELTADLTARLNQLSNDIVDTPYASLTVGNLDCRATVCELKLNAPDADAASAAEHIVSSYIADIGQLVSMDVLAGDTRLATIAIH